jgi:hypothetical protein
MSTMPTSFHALTDQTEATVLMLLLLCVPFLMFGMWLVLVDRSLRVQWLALLLPMQAIDHTCVGKVTAGLSILTINNQLKVAATQEV